MNRNSLIEKIKALLAKTTQNGCTEHEAMLALDKAREMMDAYEVTEQDLQLTREEKAVISPRANAHDKNGVREWLFGGVAKFCDVDAFKSRQRFGGPTLVFVGMKPDVDLAHWLLDNLEAFVRQSLVEYLIESGLPKGYRRHAITCFVRGACSRIGTRLIAARPKPPVAADAAARGTALVVIKQQAISDALAEAGITVRAARRSTTRLRDGQAFYAGQAAGDRAQFHKPMGSAARVAIGKAEMDAVREAARAQ